MEAGSLTSPHITRIKSKKYRKISRLVSRDWFDRYRRAIGVFTSGGDAQGLNA